MGVAGGEKYIVNNILFKFAIDFKLLYGSDHFAAKAAGSELVAISAYYRTKTPGLHLPLVTLVDYLGHRLMATALLPIDKGTHVYGSNDGGEKIRNTNASFYAMAAHTAAALGLREHSVKGLSQKKSTRVCTAFDLEGHCGKDGRFYFLDFGRALPHDPIERNEWKWFPIPRPTPILDERGNVQMRERNPRIACRFRPEFLRQFARDHQKLLTSDAPQEKLVICFHDRHWKTFEKDIFLAAKYLDKVCIPKATSDLISRFITSRPRHMEDDVITSVLHANGVNLRYLGFVFSRLRNTPLDEDVVCNLVVHVAVEAAARAMKNYINRQIRHYICTHSLSVEAPYRDLLTKYLNGFFGGVSYSLGDDKMWGDIEKQMAEWFGFISQQDLLVAILILRRKCCIPRQPDGVYFVFGRHSLTPEHMQVHLTAADQMNCDPALCDTVQSLLLKRLAKLMNLRLSTNSLLGFCVGSALMQSRLDGQDLVFPEEARVPFSSLDLKKLRVKMKGLNISSRSEANTYYLQALELERRVGSEMLAQQYYLAAEDYYQKMLKSDGSDTETIYNYHATRLRRVLFRNTLARTHAKDNQKRDVYVSKREVEEMEAALAGGVEGQDGRIKHLLGCFYVFVRKPENAEIFLLRAIKDCSVSPLFLRSYADFCKEQGAVQAAQKYSEVSRKYACKFDFRKGRLLGISDVLKNQWFVPSDPEDSPSSPKGQPVPLKAEVSRSSSGSKINLKGKGPSLPAFLWK